MKINKIIALSVALTAVLALDASPKEKKKEKEKEKEPVISRYDKIFKDKKAETKKGVVTLHKIEGKVYFEYPIALLGKDIIMGTTIEEVSNIGDAFVGQQPREPIYVKFEKNDTLITLVTAENYAINSDNDLNLTNALRKNYTPAIIHNFSILAYNKDSSAVLFEATPFLLGDSKPIRPFDPAGYNSMMGFITRTTDYKKDRSSIGEISAFSDNFSVSSYMSYGVTSVFMGFATIEEDRAYTALAKRSFLFLPEKPYKHRISDPRIGVFTVGYENYSAKTNGVDNKFYVTRWRLEPSDTAAYKRGELVTPVKPIVFYIDDKFPTKWFGYIKSGVEQWNSAYEKIGFKNAIIAKPFPKDDPEFDPNNLKYSCIRYAPLQVENAMGPSWIDPRSGEILSASVYLYHNIASLITMWRFIQTSPADHSARTSNMPESIMAESLKYIVTHEVGHCLGLMHNMAASASIPVDSLRSPTYTQKYGTTSSVMDYARFNHVAQPGDKERGVKLTPPDLGVYDYYAIKWLYSPIFPATTPEKETTTLNAWITEKMGDPMFRYGKQQVYSNYDPTSLAEDLGDDAVKSTEYGIANLKYILKNSNEWLINEDKDYEFRAYVYNHTIFQLYKYIGHLAANIGGVYINEKMEGDSYAHFQSVPKETQRRALLYLLSVLEDLSWMDDESQKKDVDMMGSISNYCQMSFMPILYGKIKDIGLSSSLAENPYSKQDALKDFYDFVFRYTIKGETPTSGNLKLQNVLITMLITDANIVPKAPARQKAVSEMESVFPQSIISFDNLQYYTPEDYSGFEFLRKIPKSAGITDHFSYGFLLDAKKMLTKAAKTNNKDLSNHYELLLIKINRALDID